MNTRGPWADSAHRWKSVRVSGLGALVAGAITIAFWLVLAAVFVAPLVFWLAWDVLGFGPAVGLPELGLVATLLATLFLIVGWFGKVALTAVVFVADPAWLHSEAVVRWPEPTLRNLIAIALLAALAASPHAREHHPDHSRGSQPGT